MSKKINISIPNKVRPNLTLLFHQYLVRKSKEPISRHNLDEWDDEEYADMVAYWDRVFPGWDEGIHDDDDDDDVVFPSNGGKCIILNPKKKGRHKVKRDVFQNFWSQSDREEKWSNKNKHRRNKDKKAKIYDISTPYDGEEDEYNFVTEDYDDGSKEIWFYPDYHEKDDKLEFNSLKDFSDYCESMGYFISEEVMDDISWRYESHCCLCPESERYGLLEVISEHSYGEMFYEACEEHELSEV